MTTKNLDVESLIRDIAEGPARWEAALESLADFQSYLSSKSPRLRIEEGCAIEKCRADLRISQSGVYLVYDIKDTLLYVGVTGKEIDARVSRHLGRFDFNRCDVVPFPPEFSWLALALESFLIGRLKPLFNKNGVQQNW